MELYAYDVPDEDGRSVHLISPLPSDIVFRWGLVPDAIAAILASDFGSSRRTPRFDHVPRERISGVRTLNRSAISKNDVIQNSGFVRMLQRSIAEHGGAMRGLRDAAAKQRTGFVYIIDPRTSTPSGDVPVEDIVGAFEVREGRIAAFSSNEHYLAIGQNGAMRIDPEFERTFLHDLERLSSNEAGPVDRQAVDALACADALLGQRRFEEASMWYQRAHDLAERSGSAAPAAAAAFALAQVRLVSGVIEEGVEWCKRALAAGSRAPDGLSQATAEAACNVAFMLERYGVFFFEALVWELLLARGSSAPMSTNVSCWLAEAPLEARAAAAHYNHGVQLKEANHSADAVRVFDFVLKQYGALAYPRVDRLLASALLNKSFELNKLGRPEEAIVCVDMLVERFYLRTEEEIEELVVLAMRHKGVMLMEWNRYVEAVAVLDDLLGRFESAPAKDVRGEVSLALVNKADALVKASGPRDAVPVYEAFLQRCDQVPDGVAPEAIAGAEVNFGTALHQIGRYEDALRAFDRIAERHSRSSETKLLSAAALAHVKKGLVLERLGRRDEAHRTWDEAIERFGPTTAPELQVNVLRAHSNKAASLLSMGRAEEALRTLEAGLALKPDERDSVLREDIAMMLNNKAVALIKLKRARDAIEVLDHVMNRFADVRTQAEIARRHRSALGDL